MVKRKTQVIVAASTIVIVRNISDSTGSIIMLITNAPITTNGMRNTSRKNMLMTRFDS